MMTKERVPFLDTARALCMLWIVGIWHMQAYLSNGIQIQNQYTNYITVSVLATFTFISGFFLGGITSFADVIHFYMKRVKRFYFLFLFSCISLYVIHLFVNRVDFIVSVKQLVCTVTGLSCFIAPMPLTIWYFSMMIFFYIITPLVNVQKTIKGKALVCFAIYVFLVFTNVFFETDERVVLYFPIYCAALIISGTIDIESNFQFKRCLMTLICSAIATLVNVLWLSNCFTQLVPAISGAVFIIEISKLLTVKKTENTFRIISYASMCAYLFHRQFFGAIEFVFGEISAPIAYGIVLPLFLICCYYIQRVYDIIVDRFVRI